MYNSFKDTTVSFRETIAEAYQQVELFNEIAGNFDNVTIDSLDSQLSFVWEELVETIDAFENKDDKEYIDGLADIFVTVAGLLQKSEKAGYNVSDAIRLVNINNLEKFPSSSTDPTITQPKDTTITFDSRFDVVVYKDANGKVKKPLDFVPVNLNGTYPDFLKEAT